MEESRSQTTFRVRKNYRDALAFVDDFSQQLIMAGQLQRDFLPKQPPDSESMHWKTIFQPAQWVSGDIYDIVRLDENHIGFYIADVVGHGMPAALLTIFLKQALKMRQTIKNNYQIFPPAKVMENLNEKLTDQKLSSQPFVTCCYCLLNTKTLKLTCCRAGHPYPLLIRPGQDICQLQSTGSLLGVFEGLQFKQHSVQLKKGDKLILYSDGIEPLIGDFDDTKGFCFNPEFLKLKDLSLNDLMAQLDITASNLPKDTPEADDMTVVALQIL